MNTQKLSNQIAGVFSEIVDFVTFGRGKAYVRYLGYILVAALIAGGLYLAQRQWIISREQRAQSALARLIETFSKENTSGEPNWNVFMYNVEDAYAKYSSSYLAPYFLNLKVEALLAQGNKKEAVEILDTVISLLDHSIPAELLRTKKALLEIDLGNVESGIALLEKLGTSEHNKVKDVAQFYLGRYYWVSDQIDKAKEIWQTLINEQRTHRISPSPWMQEAESLLETIS